MAFRQIIAIVAIVCAIWVIYDVFAKQKSMKTSTKVIWTIFAVLFSIITAIVYLIAVKSRK